MLRDAIIRDQKARVSNKALHEARQARCQRRFPVAAPWFETATGSKLHASEELKRTLARQVTSKGLMGQCADCRTFYIATLCHHVAGISPVEPERLDATPVAHESAPDLRNYYIAETKRIAETTRDGSI